MNVRAEQASPAGQVMVLKVVLYADLEMAVEICVFVHAEVVGRIEVEVINWEGGNREHRANPIDPPKVFLVVEGGPRAKSDQRTGQIMS